MLPVVGSAGDVPLPEGVGSGLDVALVLAPLDADLEALLVTLIAPVELREAVGLTEGDATLAPEAEVLWRLTCSAVARGSRASRSRILDNPLTQTNTGWKADPAVTVHIPPAALLFIASSMAPIET